MRCLSFDGCVVRFLTASYTTVIQVHSYTVIQVHNLKGAQLYNIVIVTG